jgi:glutaredoxin 3
MEVIVYSKDYCPYCDRAKALLTEKSVAYKEIRVDLDPEAFQTMLEKSQRRTVPQIFFGDKHVGGFDDLWALEQSGELELLINKTK